AVEALGIKVKAGLCASSRGRGHTGRGGYNDGGGNGGHNGGGGSNGGKGGHTGDDSYGGRNGGGGNGGHTGGGGYNGGGGKGGGMIDGSYGGHTGGEEKEDSMVVEVTTEAQAVIALGIKIDANICLGGGGSGGNEGNGGNPHPPLKGGNTCPGLVADLKLLGIPVKAEICLGGGGGGGGGGGNGGSAGNGGSGNGGCAIGANVDVTRLIGVDVCVGGGGGGSGHHGGGNEGGNGGNNGNGSRPTCQDISAKVRLLGIKVDANICLRGPNAGPRAPVLSNAPGCPTLVANAKLLGIADVNVELCLKARVNLGVGGRSIARRAALAL
ncbi:hypothetical protein K493DRAFT_309676, partial [Basidiobolus meristosporus CBS 931.73]